MTKDYKAGIDSRHVAIEGCHHQGRSVRQSQDLTAPSQTLGPPETEPVMESDRHSEGVHSFIQASGGSTAAAGLPSRMATNEVLTGTDSGNLGRPTFFEL